MKKKISNITEFAAQQPVLIFFLIFILFSFFFAPGFATKTNLQNIIFQSSELIVLACGYIFVIMNGGTDFSITSNIAIGSVVGAMIMSTSEGLLKDSPAGFVVAILAMLAIGLLIGAINGFSTTVLKMPSFIATMVTQLIFSGLALWIPASRTIPNLPEAFGAIGYKWNSVIIAVIVVAVCYYLLHKTVFGRQLFAIGINHKTSMISGIKVKKVIFRTFLLSGFLAALGGIIMTAKIGGGVPDLGRTIFLDVLAALIIGGTSVAGGRGSVLGAAEGALFIVILKNSMSCFGIQWYVQDVFKGLLVLVAAILDMGKIRKS